MVLGEKKRDTKKLLLRFCLEKKDNKNYFIKYNCNTNTMCQHVSTKPTTWKFFVVVVLLFY